MARSVFEAFYYSSLPPSPRVARGHNAPKSFPGVMPALFCPCVFSCEEAITKRDANVEIWQITFMKKVAEVVAGVKNGVGIFYWEPAWMNNQGLGSSCESNTMFTVRRAKFWSS